MIRRTFFKPDVLCCAEGCTVPLEPGKLFCLGHYRSLPKPMRNALWDAWRAAMKARKAKRPRVEQNALGAVYQAAFQNCCEYLRTTPLTTTDAMSTIAIAANGQSVTYVGGRML